MIKIEKYSFIVLIAFLIALNGCRKFDDILVLVEDGEVSFTLPPSKLEDGQQYMLYDIAVTDLTCEKDCVMWEMVRQPEGVQIIQRNMLVFPVQYGVVLANMQNRVMKKLTSGHYSVVATIALIEDSKITTTKLLQREFEIK